MNKWLGIEVCERSLVSVKSFSDQKEAIDHANHLLKQWAKIGRASCRERV